MRPRGPGNEDGLDPTSFPGSFKKDPGNEVGLLFLLFFLIFTAFSGTR